MPRLLDFTTCETYYPDETPVDCDEDEQYEAMPERPEGWVCWFGSNPPNGDHASLWTDGEGHWGMYYDIDINAVESENAYGRVEAMFPNTHVEILFKGPSRGFIQFPEPIHERVEKWRSTYRQFEPEGVPDDLFTEENLDVHATFFEGRPWYVAVIGHEDGDLYFPISMTYWFDNWVPGGTRYVGEDFELSIGHGRYVANNFTTWQIPEPYSCTVMAEEQIEQSGAF